ncbi:MAG: hypothetical protein AB2417_07130 [Clostridiaceae bacterium]
MAKLLIGPVNVILDIIFEDRLIPKGSQLSRVGGTKFPGADTVARRLLDASNACIVTVSVETYFKSIEAIGLVKVISRESGASLKKIVVIGEGKLAIFPVPPELVGRRATHPGKDAVVKPASIEGTGSKLLRPSPSKVIRKHCKVVELFELGILNPPYNYF